MTARKEDQEPDKMCVLDISTRPLTREEKCVCGTRAMASHSSFVGGAASNNKVRPWKAEACPKDELAKSRRCAGGSFGCRLQRHSMSHQFRYLSRSTSRDYRAEKEENGDQTARLLKPCR
eukprot:3509982-Amphidinium_carterae.1